MLAIDLCAGIGWSVACRWLGVSELGFEIMPEAIATREAMGAVTQAVSIVELPDSFCSQAPIQIAGPPCQTFSAAGNGEGRKALAEVLFRARYLAAHGVLLRRADDGDPRTWLVLEPLRLALGGRPMYIVWEQVPAVLPVWQTAGEILTAAGYSVWTGILNAEQYGVPQTRKRAFLIARRDGWAAMPPVPTHSRYYSTNRAKLDQGVLPWVSMAQALGWGTTGRPSFTVTGGGSNTGGAEPFGRAARDSLMSMRRNSGPGAARDPRPSDEPSYTIRAQGSGSHPSGVEWVYRSSAHPNATMRDGDQPAPTVMFGNAGADVQWVQRSNYSGTGVPSPVPGSPDRGARTLDEPSATLTGRMPHWAVQTGTNSEMVRADGRPWQERTKKYSRPVDEPSPTIVGERMGQWRVVDDQSPASIRVTVEEAAALQTFPYPELIQGTSGKRYLQVGNMVPPVLGAAILKGFL